MQNNILNNLKNLKKKKIWFLFLKIFFLPIYDFIWKNLLNLHARIMYFLWFTKKREFYDLGKTKSMLVKSDPIFFEIAQYIKNSCKEVLKDAKNKIYSDNETEGNFSNINKDKYFIQIYNDIDLKTKKKIIDFARSEKMISTAAKYLGVFPILSMIALTFNVPRNVEKRRGAMLFHKDEKGFKSLDFFLNISDINSDSGPLRVLKTSYDNLGPLSFISHQNKFSKAGFRDKIDDETISNKFSRPEDFLSNEGPIGTGLFIDSFAHFHGGGHCKKNNRLLLRVLYSSVDCTVLPNKELVNNDYLLNGTIKYNNYFEKFFFYKRSIIFFNKTISRYLVQFYKLLQFKF